MKTDFASKADARVQIAKDVLKQLKLGRLTAEQGTYAQSEDPIVDTEVVGECYYRTAVIPPDAQLKKLIKAKQCRVCGLGAAFIVAVDRFNDLKLQGCHVESDGRLSLDASPTKEYLARFFSERQIDLIEAAFEGYQDIYYYVNNFEDPNERLTAIMKNIVKNEGTFRPVKEEYDE